MSVVELPPRGVLGTARTAQTAVSALATADLSDLTGNEAVDLLGLLRPMVAQLESASLRAMEVVRESGVWGLDGSRSARAFLERATRVSGAKVSSDLKLAERLATVLPLTAAALREGAISVEHALALSRGACGTAARIEALADPDRGEGSLVAHAGLPVDAFKLVVARWGHRVDPDADDAKRRADDDGYHLDLAETMDGVHVRGFLTPEVGEAFLTGLTSVIGVPTADGRSPGRRRHDALATLVQLALCSGGLGTSSSIRPQLMVGLHWETLIGMPGLKGLDPAFLLESQSPIPRHVLDRIACDSQVTRIVFGPQGQVLDVGRSQRTFTGPRRQALDARDGGCRAPGCNAPPRLCEGHHKVPWRLGGVTSVDEGYLLCWAHHDWFHARDIRVEDTGDGGLRFVGPDGRCYGTTHPRQLTLPGS